MTSFDLDVANGDSRCGGQRVAPRTRRRVALQPGKRRKARAETARLAQQQTALRRVAALVAQRASPNEISRAVADEAAGLLGADTSTLIRFENAGTITVMVGTLAGPMGRAKTWRLIRTWSSGRA